MEDLDPAEFERFRRLCSTGTGDEGLRHLSNEQLLTALRLSGPPGDPSGVSLGAILLFGTSDTLNRWAPTAECLFQDDRDATARVNETLRFPLLRLAEELAERITLRNTHTELLFGLHRLDLPLVTERTSREAVANALIHRDYSELGPITVRFTNDALTVNSPGGFPYGVTLSTMLDDSRPRSVALADAFKRAGLVERRGQGINDMFFDQLRAGRSVPDYSGTSAYNVSVALPVASADLDMVRFIVTFEDRNQTTLDLEELRILHELKDAGSLPMGELLDDLHMSKEKTRSTLTRLTSKGLVEARGNGRSRRYHLAASFYAFAEDRNAYVRLRGMDGAQNEQMVLDYVRSYGTITRAQAADLCQLPAPAASRMLRGLAARGLLQMQGERRSAHYVSPSIALE